MHPYAIDQMVQERRQELLRLRGTDRGVGSPREERPPARRRALVAVAVAVGAPWSRRRAARRVVTAPLGVEACLDMKG
jgi:hypothetical protein